MLSPMADYHFDTANRIGVFRPGASPNVTDITATMERFAAEPGFGPDVNFLSDRRGVTDPPDTAYVRGIVMMVEWFHRRFGKRRWAVLVDPDNSAMYGMGRLAEAHTELQNITMRVFTDYDEAVRWLRATEAAPQA